MLPQCFDYTDLPKNSKIAIYGAGKRGIEVSKEIQTRRDDVEIVCFLDSYAESECNGFPKRILANMPQVDYILIASYYMTQIYLHLMNNNIPEEIICFYSLNPNFFPRQAMVSHEKKFIYIPVAKVAHTSLKNAFSPYCPQGTENIDFTHSQYDGYLKFAFTRNPYARLISMFIEKMTKPEYVNFFQKVLGTTHITFKDIVTIVTHFKPGACDPHWIPQSYSFCLSDDTILPDRLFRLDDLPGALAKLESMVGITIKMPHLNKSKKNQSSSAYYDENTKKSVFEYYKRDFINFGYPG